MKKLLFLILVAISVKFAWGYPLEKPTSNYSERAWLEGIGNYEKAKQLAAEHNAPLMVYVYTDWCGYCRKFQNELLYSPQYRENFKPVVKLRINPSVTRVLTGLCNSIGSVDTPRSWSNTSTNRISVDCHHLPPAA